MAGNSSLHEAKVQKNDEFYTRLVDIENELGHYTEHFKDKVVLCNCDDPEYSNFCKYFALNFNYLGLKKLITTHYEKGKQSYKLEYARVDDPSGQLSLPEAVQTPLQGDGDFRSEECIEILKEADIVVTNPPFSCFREYIAQLIEYDKSFLILGNPNAITYKEIFPLIKDNKMWIGSTSLNGGRWMIMPSNIEIKSDKAKINERGETVINVPGVCWFANIDHGKRHQPLLLDTMAHNLKYNKKLQKKFKQDYEKIEYKFYDEYDAIDIPFVECIPSDFNEIMGVPITFLDKYCPEQFKIIGLDRYVKDNPHYGHRFTINGKETYARILIKKKEGIYSNENRITY